MVNADGAGAVVVEEDVVAAVDGAVIITADVVDVEEGDLVMMVVLRPWRRPLKVAMIVSLSHLLR